MSTVIYKYFPINNLLNEHILKPGVSYVIDLLYSGFLTIMDR